MERVLASVERIIGLAPIPGADAILAATIKGWTIVVKKGEFSIGDKVVYFEIDSWIPEPLAPFLTRGVAKEYQGIVGNRLKTIRLRGQLSQGLALPLPEAYADSPEGTDLTESLGIIKYDPPVPAQLAGECKGLFPDFIKKTDEERVQNLDYNRILDYQRAGVQFYAAEKLDGTSSTFYVNDGEFGICSRNLDLRLRASEKKTSYEVVAERLGLEEKLLSLGKNIAIQGELTGPGIGKNPYNLSQVEFFLFNVFDIDLQERLPLSEALEVASELGVKTVPILNENFTLPGSRQEMLEIAEGKSSVFPKANREGIVVRSLNGFVSFKAISNAWLLKEK